MWKVWIAYFLQEVNVISFCLKQVTNLNKMAMLWMWICWLRALLRMGHFLLMWNSSDEIKMTDSNNSNCESPRSRCDARLFAQTFLQ